MGARYLLSQKTRLAYIRSRVNHPSMANAFDQMINTPDMIIFRSEVKARLAGGADAA